MKSNILFGMAIVSSIFAAVSGCSTNDSETSDFSETYVSTQKTVDLYDQVTMNAPEPNSELASRLDLFTKVVVAVEDAVIFIDPSTNAKADTRMPFFQPLYVFGRKQVNGINFLAVGRSFKADSKLGFIREDDVVYWQHRVGFLPQYSPTRSNRIRLYASPEDVKACLNGDEVEPIAEYVTTEARPRPEQPWLICDKKTIGKGKIAYRVYALGKKNSDEKNDDGKDAYTTDEIESLSSAVRRADVVFCVDGTGSMVSAIENVKSGVSHIAQALQNYKSQYDVDLKFGLIVYRDVCDGAQQQYEFNDLNELNVFLSKIETVKADGGGDEEERGFLGALDAIKQTSWRHMSIRHLFIVGDARWHESGVNNPGCIGIDDLAKEAENSRIHVSILAVEREDLKDQLASLASRTQGETRLFENVDELSLDLAKKLEENMEESKLNGIVFDGRAKGQDISTIARETGKSIEAIYDVVRVLKTQGVDFERFKNRLDEGQTVVVNGWILVDENANELEIYLFKFEAENVKAMLSSFRQSEGSFLDRYYDGMMLAIGSRVQSAPNYVSRFNFSNSGLPFGPHSVLRYTEDDFRAMGEAERSKLFEELDARIIKFDAFLNNDSRWNRFAKTPAGWIPENAFP